MRRLPLWVPLAPIAATAALLGVGISQGRARAEPDDGVPWVDPALVELDGFPEWADPRWAAEFNALLLSWPPFRADDQAELTALGSALGALSFVSEAEPPTVDRTGALRIAVRLRRPIAAIWIGERCATVDRDGVLLSGDWPAPPRVSATRGASLDSGAPDAFWLPVVEPGLGASGELLSFAGALPGDFLVEEAHLDALDVAASLAEHLDAQARRSLGRASIDASRGRATSPDEPGVRLLLEDERIVLFGRPPAMDAPGELPAAAKWASLARALALLESDEPDARAWDLVDVRWDVPELRFAGDAEERVRASLGLAAAETPANAAPRSSSRSAHSSSSSSSRGSAAARDEDEPDPPPRSSGGPRGRVL